MFTDEIRKMKGCKNGMSADDKYCSKWKYLQQLSFLMCHVHITPGKTTSKLQLEVSMFFNGEIVSFSESQALFHSGIHPGVRTPWRSVGPPGKFDQQIFFGALPETR
jgi:hypothetical protein